MDDYKVSDFARRRMKKSKLTQDDANYVIDNQEHTYQSKGDTVFVATLPDGRSAKVRVRDKTLIDAFTYKASL